jgi:hypothetical protein
MRERRGSRSVRVAKPKSRPPKAQHGQDGTINHARRCVAWVTWWGTFMGDWYPDLRRLWFVAAQFAVAMALVVTVAAIAKYSL